LIPSTLFRVHLRRSSCMTLACHNEACIAPVRKTRRRAHVRAATPHRKYELHVCVCAGYYQIIGT